ncbi:hypothetical protein [Maribacter halichondriae]|uniref:hypothetical protein n=1 Tax=Maribacter halichondriae TaxID=2980554 RepID=UPI00235A0305|nr:hypothetical protein [Maribacter sp. Hal144]
MSLTPDNFRKALLKGKPQDFQIEALDSFVNSVERDFFASIYLTKELTKKKGCLLTLELTCNLSLAGILFHFNRNEWGAFDAVGSSLSKNLEVLESNNPFSIDIDEFSLFLKDTAIIINRIHSKSILEQLHTIISEIARHYVHMTKALDEMPFEIYVPVFDSNNEDKDDTAQDSVEIDKSPEEYYKYWGLYFDSGKNPMIYSLENHRLFSADLFIFP